MDYNTIKSAAKELGCSCKDLITLAPQNDPFYIGSKAELEKAHWFADLWQRFGYAEGVHLRRIHYRVVSQDPPTPKADGALYENTEADWDYLNQASKYARYLDLVPASAFVDRRNPEARVFARYLKPGDLDYQDPEPQWYVGVYGDWHDYHLPGLPDLPDLPDWLPRPPGFGIRGYDGIQQPYLVELWAEKTTMNDVLEPLCRRNAVNLITGAGELSITAVLDLMNRVRQARRPARILYISDYDPAGLGMPVSVARKIEYFHRERGYDGLDIRLEPIILSAEQVAFYDLPRVPVKDSDRRKANWIARRGEGQVELDALEALHPGEFGRIVQGAILQYHDPDLQTKAERRREELNAVLQEQRQAIIARHQDEFAALRAEYDGLLSDYQETRARFASLIAGFQVELDTCDERLAALRERAGDLHAGVIDELSEVSIDMGQHALPEPDLPAESNGLLYDSGRDYFAQLEHYKAHQGNRGADFTLDEDAADG